MARLIFSPAFALVLSGAGCVGGTADLGVVCDHDGCGIEVPRDAGPPYDAGHLAPFDSGMAILPSDSDTGSNDIADVADVADVAVRDAQAPADAAPPPDAGCSPHCDTGQACAMSGDCTSLVCTNRVCQAPTCNDGVKNGLETGVDCDGPCPFCDGDPCIADPQCKSGLCFDVCETMTCTTMNYATATFTTPNGAVFTTGASGTQITGMTTPSNNHPIVQVPGVTSGSRYQIEAEVLMSQPGEFGIIFNGSATGAYAMGSRYGGVDDPDLIQFTSAGMWNPGPLQIGPSFTSVAGTTYTLKFQVHDQSFRGRLWDRAATEPTAWQVTASLPTLPGDGGIGFYTYFTFPSTLVSLRYCPMTP